MKTPALIQLYNTCVFCNNTFRKRKTGDHILPQGLGKFHPEFILKNVCETCDTRHGNYFERVATQTGFIGLFRLKKHIKSKNNKGSKYFNPLFDKDFGKSAGKFSIRSIGENSYEPYISDNGEIYSPQYIEVLKDGKVEKVFLIPNKRTTNEVCDFISNIISTYGKGYNFELRLAGPEAKDVFVQLKERGHKVQDVAQLPQDKKYTIFHISSFITDDHLRFTASIGLKSMLYCGYSTTLLQNLLFYVDKGLKRQEDSALFDISNTNMGILNDPDLSNFYHQVIWRFTQTRLLMTTSLFAQAGFNGLRFVFDFTLGPDSSILIPCGSLIAKYGCANNKNVVTLMKGDQEINK